MQEGTVLRKQAGVSFLTFDLLSQTGLVRHAFSTRDGGVSTGPFATMNLSFKRGDDPDRVSENFCRMARALDMKAEDMVLSDQTHTSNVRRITREERGMGIVSPQSFSDVDGMVTDVPGLMLVTSHADCVPLYFVDPVRRAIGLSHSGWKGTALKIGRVTVEKMGREFGSRPEDILAVIGPCISQPRYEVGGDVADQFREAFSGQSVDDILCPKGHGKYMLDLRGANRRILRGAGLTENHIYISDLCTYVREDLFWSHRRTAGVRGGMAAFLCLSQGRL